MEDIKQGYTRVSTILNILPSLMNTEDDGREVWGFPLQEINQEMLKNKCIIGTNVHGAIHAWSSGEFFPLNECEKGYFASFSKWQYLTRLVCVKSELRMYDETLKITGAIDMLGEIQGNKSLMLIDFKTSAASDKKKWPLQAAFYHHLLKVNGFSPQETVLFVQLDKKGEMPKCHEFFIDNKLKTLMISAYNIYKHLT